MNQKLFDAVMQADRSEENAFFESMIRRNDLVENFYKKMEENLPCDPMSDEMLTAMNTSLGFKGPHAKDRTYRPYCVRRECKMMPRMMRVKEGFRCWSCHNVWDLTVKSEPPIQTM